MFRVGVPASYFRCLLYVHVSCRCLCILFQVSMSMFREGVPCFHYLFMPMSLYVLPLKYVQKFTVMSIVHLDPIYLF